MENCIFRTHGAKTCMFDMSYLDFSECRQESELTFSNLNNVNLFMFGWQRSRILQDQDVEKTFACTEILHLFGRNPTQYLLKQKAVFDVFSLLLLVT